MFFCRISPLSYRINLPLCWLWVPVLWHWCMTTNTCRDRPACRLGLVPAVSRKTTSRNNSKVQQQSCPTFETLVLHSTCGSSHTWHSLHVMFHDYHITTVQGAKCVLKRHTHTNQLGARFCYIKFNSTLNICTHRLNCCNFHSSIKLYSRWNVKYKTQRRNWIIKIESLCCTFLNPQKSTHGKNRRQTQENLKALYSCFSASSTAETNMRL